MQNTSSAAGVQAGPSPPRALRLVTQGPDARKGPWQLRVSREFLLSGGGLSDGEFRVFLAIEAHASEKRPYCWPGLGAIQGATGKAETTLRLILDGLEAAGWVLRAYGIRKRLLGFILLKRADQDADAADTPARVADARRALEAHAPAPKKLRPGASQPPKNCALSPQDFGVSSPQDSAPSPGPPIEDEPLPSEPLPLNERSIERTERFSDSEGTETEDEPQARPTRRAMNAAALESAREMQARVYAGMPPNVAAKDWRGWKAMYLGVARELLRGELTAKDIDDAIAIARRPGTNKRGARFFATLNNGGPDQEPAPAPLPTPTPQPERYREPDMGDDARIQAERMAADPLDAEKFKRDHAEFFERHKAQQQRAADERKRQDDERKAAKDAAEKYEAAAKAHDARLKAEWEAMTEEARGEVRKPILDMHPGIEKFGDKALMPSLLFALAERRGWPPPERPEGYLPPGRRTVPSNTIS